MIVFSSTTVPALPAVVKPPEPLIWPVTVKVLLAVVPMPLVPELSSNVWAAVNMLPVPEGA